MNITFHLIKNLVQLKASSSNCFEELSSLAKVVKLESKPVAESSLQVFFEHGGVIAIALDEGVIVGSACLIRSYKYNDYSFRIEHVSTLPSFQKQGIAGKLVLVLHEEALEKGEGYIDLSCEPFREQANRLYERLGYEIRNTNSRRLRFHSAL